jgi:hypothetical protein
MALLLMATWNWIGFIILAVIVLFLLKVFIFGERDED